MQTGNFLFVKGAWLIPSWHFFQPLQFGTDHDELGHENIVAWGLLFELGF